MKRIIILSIVLLFLLHFNVPRLNAQISFNLEPGICKNVQNTFFDCKLGVSTYQFVYRTLKSKGFDVSNCTNNSYISIFNVKFAGIHFDRANFGFVDGRFAGIQFINSFDSYQLAQQVFDDLYNIVKRTYPLQPTKHENSVELERYAATNNIRTVVVNLTREQNNYGTMFYHSKLIYFDNNLVYKPYRGL